MNNNCLFRCIIVSSNIRIVLVSSVFMARMNIVGSVTRDYDMSLFIV